MSRASCCRICLSESALNPIFRDSQQADIYSQVIEEITGLQIYMNDELPQVMCKKCIDFINESIEFRRRGLQTESILIKRLDPNSFQKIKLIRSRIKTDKKIIPSLTKEEHDMFIFRKISDENDGYKLKSEVGLKRRLRGKEEIECKLCRKILTSRGSVKSHIKRHVGLDIVCEHCGCKFINKDRLLSHCRAKHEYEKVDKCSYCDYRGNDKRQVKIHERLHTGERPYVCDQCGANFHRKENLSQHMANHITTKTVPCGLCPSMFKTKHLLNVHKHHVHTQKQFSYRCYVCHNIFASRKNVFKHLRGIHSISKPDTKRIEKVFRKDSLYNITVLQ